MNRPLHLDRLEQTIFYELEKDADVDIEITDLTGRVVLTIDEGQKPAGTHKITLDANQLGKGIYFYSLISGNNKITKRMVVD